MAKIVIKSKGAVHKMITARRSNDIDRRPGSLQPDLVNRIPDVLAREFSRVGEDLYDKTMSEITESVKRNFGEGIQTLQSTVTEETGRQGFEKSKRFIHDWLRGIVSDLQIKGVPGLADSLGNLASEFSVQYRESPGEEGETTDEGEALLEVEAPKPAATPSKEEPEKEKAEEVTDEDLTAILEGKEAGGGEAKVETAAGTLGEFRRRLRSTRSKRRIQAQGQTRAELLRAAAVHLADLEA